MKRFVVFTILVVLALSLANRALGEGRYIGVAKEEYVDSITGEVDVHYLMGIQYDLGTHGEVVTIAISEESYNRILETEEKERQYHDNLWYVKAGKWCSTSASNVADWVTFWN